MNKNNIYLFLSVIILFVLTYFLNYFFIEIFNVKNTAFVWHFYFFISGVTAIMLLSLIFIFNYNSRYTGHTFIIWTMIKLMAVMVFFLIFVFEPDVSLKNNVLYNIAGLYILYLIYEVFFTISLIKKSG